MTVQDYLQRKGFNYRIEQRPSGPNAVMNCPLCNDTEQKFAINLETGAFNCLHENRCGERGSFWQFQKIMGDEPVPRRNEHQMFAKKPRQVYKRPEVHAKAPQKKTVEYLAGRKISEDTLKRFRIGESAKGEIMFPYFKGNELVNVKYRSLDKQMRQEKAAEPVLYGRDFITDDPLLICEGEIDALSWYEYGYLAVSVPSGVSDLRWIENEWEWLERFRAIYVCMDTDEAGQQAVEEIASRLGKWRCYHVVLPKKDVNDCLTAGVPKEEIDRCIETARGYSLDTLVTPSFYADEVVDLFLNPGQLDGLKTGLNGLNYTLRGWREGELTVWSGANGSGKTTILNQEMLTVMFRHEQRVCIASLEMRPARLLRWLVMQGKTTPNENQIRGALDRLDPYLLLLNVTQEMPPEVLVDAFEFAARKYGVKHFVVDSLMRIALPGYKEMREQKKFVDSLLEFAKKYRAHVHLVAHPRKGDKDTDAPGKVDIAGTGDITNLAHNVLIMYRFEPEVQSKVLKDTGILADGILYVKKNREHGTQGRIYLRFNENTKTYHEVEKQREAAAV